MASMVARVATLVRRSAVAAPVTPYALVNAHTAPTEKASFASWTTKRERTRRVVVKARIGPTENAANTREMLNIRALGA